LLKNELVETLSIGDYKSLWKKNDVEGSLEEVMINVQSVAKKMESKQDNSLLQYLVDVILDKVPLEIMDRVKRIKRNDVTDANSQ